MESTEGVCNLLLACTGSVASMKVPAIIEKCLKSSLKVQIKLVTTENALHFYDHTSLPVEVYRDSDEWKMWKKRADPVLHIELRRWADLMVIAPLDANTLAKVAAGMCDNLLTCVVRAWDMQRPLLFAPAMNTHMWEHPLTTQQVAVLQQWGYKELPCVEKTLICGDTGFGAMAEVDTIVTSIEHHINEILNNKNKSPV